MASAAVRSKGGGGDSVVVDSLFVVAPTVCVCVCACVRACVLWWVFVL